MSLSLENLKPYISLILLRAKNGNSRDIASFLQEGTRLIESTPGRKVIEKGPPDQKSPVGFLHFQEERSPGWTNDPGVKDLYHHLFVVYKYKKFIALLVTDPSIMVKIRLSMQKPGTVFSNLAFLDEAFLNAAFAAGAVRTLWLSGIHRRTSVKADSKVLSGLDLKDALEPVGDQSYYFTSARCVTKFQEDSVPVGLSPRQSRIWIGPVNTWEKFEKRVKEILTGLDRLERGGYSKKYPLPVLAVPVASIANIHDAFDMCVIAPEVVTEAMEDRTNWERLERWTYQGLFCVEAASGMSLLARVYFEGIYIGKLNIQISATDPKQIEYEVSTEDVQSGQEQLLDEAMGICRNPRHIQIRFESGHTISGGQVYSQRYRDVQFTGWFFCDFTGTDITKEKPAAKQNGKETKPAKFAPQEVGKQDSLFCWVVRNWPLEGKGKDRGWLACNDGSMEIADFIHLDTAEKPPTLSIIHVKGAHGAANDKGISVSAYEVVIAQALKNLRNLDRDILYRDFPLRVGKAIRDLVWHNGVKQSSRTGMQSALKALGDNYRRRVVVIQPDLTRDARDHVLAVEVKSPNSGAVIRLKQLETLLVDASNNCHDMGADFSVISCTARPVVTKKEKQKGREPRR